ncbi:MAG: homoserine O-acetyltransferase [Bacteroidia bacterium]|nr:MAG: homoserine O-acetyltransferase [Bacteroidia bacterium]
MEILKIGNLELENGGQLKDVQLAYHTYGNYIPGKTPVVWVCHALTANSDVFSWWPGLFGQKDLFNPVDYFIICVNNLGSCYGSTGPLSINPDTKSPYFHHFPKITIRDIVNSLNTLRKKLGIDQIDLLIGGSQGGQIALEWALLENKLIKNLVLVSTNAKHSAWGIAFNESQRLAIFSDRTYFSYNKDGGTKGLQAARSIALLSYRNYKTYTHFQTDDESLNFVGRKAATYQQYQGKKLVNRFNAFSYVALSYAMDSHDVFRGRTNDCLKSIKANTLVIGIKEDILFPIEEQEFLAKSIDNAHFEIIESLYGHDGFLIETQKLSEIIKSFLKKKIIDNKKLIYERI